MSDQARLAKTHPLDQPPSAQELAFHESLTRMSDRQLAGLYYRLSRSAGHNKGLVTSAHLHGQMIAIEQEQATRAKRERAFAADFARGLLLLGCILGLVLMCSGCASTNTVLRVGVHADITDITSGCRRNVDPGCGLLGPREVAKIELMWAPSVRPGPYCSLSDDSHYSAGFPFNGRFEGFVHTAGCGGFFQFGGRR